MRHLGPSALSLCLLGACGDVGASYERDLLAAVPADATFVVSLLDAEVVRERGRENAFVQLFADEAWPDARRAFERLLREGAPVEIDPLGALADVDGEIVAYFRFPDEIGEPEFGLVAEATDADPELIAFWNALLGMARAEGDMREVQHEGVTLHVLDDGEQSAFFRTDAVCGFTISDVPGDDPAIAAARGILDRLRADDPGIRANPRFTAACAGRPSDPILRAFVDRPGPLALRTRSVPMMDADAFKALGGEGLEWALLDVDLGAEEDLSLHASVHVPKDGLFGEILAQLGSAPVELLERVPASSHAAGVGDIDAVGVFRAIRAFQERVAPGETESFARGLAEFREEVGVDFVEDVLGNLTGRFTTSSVPVSLSGVEFRALTERSRSPLAMAAAWNGAAMTVEVEDAERAERATLAFDRILAESFPPLRDDFLFGNPPEWDGSSRRGGPRLQLVGSSVVFSAHESSMRATAAGLRGDAGRSFADEPGVRARARAVKGASMIGVARTSTSVEVIVGALRSASMGAAMGNNRELEWMATVHWPHPANIVGALDGLLVQSVTRDGDRLSFDLVAR